MNPAGDGERQAAGGKRQAASGKRRLMGHDGGKARERERERERRDGKRKPAAPTADGARGGGEVCVTYNTYRAVASQSRPCHRSHGDAGDGLLLLLGQPFATSRQLRRRRGPRFAGGGAGRGTCGAPSDESRITLAGSNSAPGCVRSVWDVGYRGGGCRALQRRRSESSRDSPRWAGLSACAAATGWVSLRIAPSVAEHRVAVAVARLSGLQMRRCCWVSVSVSV